MLHLENKPCIYELPFSLLPQARDWKVGQTYAVEMKLKQTSISETGASFEIVQATSIEDKNSSHKKKRMSSDTGVAYL